MTPSRPYLVRGLFEWILDNDQTPYILVDANAQGVAVPQEFVQNGQIVLNISPNAVRELLIENEQISFSARFSGITHQIFVPVLAVLAIYARENGQGMVFGHEAGAPDPDDPQPPKGTKTETAKPAARPALKVVK
ncbi:MAG: ClpXP protease specificity-enhancing factor [Oceanospirillaceae bacterium]|nr:ClpXP protease specificity-enhancing factor [Oceanospirillaceae bacterium]MCP5351085.1 ClpXP protease specificity-enhancing factor [Oceanospirillaceae bacterium]